jgi:hypothetical protein
VVTEGREDRVLKRLRQHLTYANVVATLALFVALGGTSYAALTITGRNVKNGSLTYKDLKRNTLGGSRINESRLGRVRRASNADRLNGVTAAELRVRCPTGTTPVSDVCMEVQPRLPAAYGTAVLECASADTPRTPGRRLPTHGELRAALGGLMLAPGGELTSHVFPSSSDPGEVTVLYVTDVVGHVALTPGTFAGRKAFRCVADPLN